MKVESTAVLESKKRKREKSKARWQRYNDYATLYEKRNYRSGASKSDLQAKGNEKWKTEFENAKTSIGLEKRR